MKFHLLCGYKRSGKDTFYKKIQLGKFFKYNKYPEDPSQNTIKHSLNHYTNIYLEECVELDPHFYILSNPGVIESTASIEALKNSISKPIRMAMANMVKQEVNHHLKIGFKSKEMEELAKDNLTIYDEEKSKYRVLREYYIEHAMKMREINPNHWCNQAYLHLLTSEEESDDIVITDWRFKNEREFYETCGPVITYRIFRSETDDENFFDVSEHSLDQEHTDFLVVGSFKDIEKAKSKFPQYKDYTIVYYT
jgi:hypothetical protein